MAIPIFDNIKNRKPFPFSKSLTSFLKKRNSNNGERKTDADKLCYLQVEYEKTKERKKPGWLTDDNTDEIYRVLFFFDTS